ncbi:putative amidophosphoribosyltransferase [Staphylococcus carnosus]|nr:putative amidophosphoribosyltransferase [Staphylococcus carnosus]
MCEVIASQIHLPKKQYDFIVPIPSLIKEDMKRTFNPVTQVLNAKKVSYTNLLVKNRTTGSTAFQGKHNMKNLFDLTQAAHSFNLENKTILLVNDIYTTGVTEHQAAEILFVRKIGKVDVFTFVR